MWMSLQDIQDHEIFHKVAYLTYTCVPWKLDAVAGDRLEFSLACVEPY